MKKDAFVDFFQIYSILKHFVKIKKLILDD